MTTVNIHEAKTQFSKLFERVQRGEEVVIARSGQPVARRVPYEPPRQRVAAPGSLSGPAPCEIGYRILNHLAGADTAD